MPIRHIQSDEEFINLVQNTSHDFVFVDFYADWCGPCKRIAPTLETISKEYTNVEFVKVNVDELDGLSGAYKIRAMPTFLIFQKGASLDKEGFPEKLFEPVTGASEDKIRNLLKTATSTIQVTDEF